jgi:hypothetical protein
MEGATHGFASGSIIRQWAFACSRNLPVDGFPHDLCLAHAAALGNTLQHLILLFANVNLLAEHVTHANTSNPGLYIAAHTEFDGCTVVLARYHHFLNGRA